MPAIKSDIFPLLDFGIAALPRQKYAEYLRVAFVEYEIEPEAKDWGNKDKADLG